MLAVADERVHHDGAVGPLTRTSPVPCLSEKAHSSSAAAPATAFVLKYQCCYTPDVGYPTTTGQGLSVASERSLETTLFHIVVFLSKISTALELWLYGWCQQAL